MELIPTFMDVLEGFRPVFTEPSFATFQLLMVGWIVSHRHRFVTDLIVSSDAVENGHFSDDHRFFSQASWKIDDLWKLLARALVSQLVGLDTTIILAGDDTLCRKRGLGLFGAGMHHDPLCSSRKWKVFHWGHDWVTLSLIIANPWWAPGKVFALPICMRLYRNRQGLTKGKNKAWGGTNKKAAPSSKRQRKQAKRQARKQRRVAARRAKTGQTPPKKHATRPELMREMLQSVAGWFPERRLFFWGDSLYTGESVLRYLPENVDMIGAVHPQGALYEPAAPKKPGRGASRKKGKRLPTRERWAARSTPWTPVRFDQFGLHGQFAIKTCRGLYYKAGRDQLLQFVLSRDTQGQRPTQIFYCTNLQLAPREILSQFSYRWALEVTHHDTKQFLGLEDPANRVPLAVERTAPMAMFLYSLTVLWYSLHGHQHLRFPNRPWYRRKSQPSFPDMLTTLRRISWENQFRQVRKQPTLWNKTVERLTYLATLAG